MNNAAYDTRKMRAFLLGSLSGEETELFDELSFTDDRFAEQLSAEEKELVDEYARGQLTGEALESFENYYLASPLRRARVEFASAFQSFAEKKAAGIHAAPLAETAEPAARTGEKVSAGGFAGWNIFRHLDYAFQLGLVAATLLFIGIGVWFWLESPAPNGQAGVPSTGGIEPGFPQTDAPPEPLSAEKAETEKGPDQLREDESKPAKAPKETPLVAQNQTPQPEAKRNRSPVSPPQTQPERTPSISAGSQPPPVEPRIGVASIVLAPSLRGGEDPIPLLSIPPSNGFIEARLELETSEFAAYRVALVDLANRTLWQSAPVKAVRTGDAAALTVRFPSKNLKPQVYTLVVSGIEAKGVAVPLTGYPFRLAID